MFRPLIVALALASTPAFASGSSVFQVLSERITCKQAQRVVANKGAVIFFYGADLSLYNRVVYHGGFCMSGEELRPVQAPTRDINACDVGYTCEARASEGGGGEGNQ